MKRKRLYAGIRMICLLVGYLCLTLISSAQTLKPSNVVSLRKLSIPPKAVQEFEQGVELLAKNDAAGSLQHFQRAVTEFPSYYEAYYKIRVADMKLWRMADAEQAFRRSVELSGGHYSQPLLALGEVLDLQEKFTEAEGVIRRGLGLDPTSWSGHFCLGWALFGLNRLEEAENSVREALREKTDSTEAIRLLIDIHAREMDYDSLVKDLDEYLKLDPESKTGVGIKILRDRLQRMLAESRSTTALAKPNP